MLLVFWEITKLAIFTIFMWVSINGMYYLVKGYADFSLQSMMHALMIPAVFLAWIVISHYFKRMMYVLEKILIALKIFKEDPTQNIYPPLPPLPRTWGQKILRGIFIYICVPAMVISFMVYIGAFNYR